MEHEQKNMATQRPRFEIVILGCLIALSLAIGLSIPPFYEWTGSDQSRPSPLLWIAPLALVIASLVFSMVLPWLPFSNWKSETPPLRIQFDLKAIVIATAVVAVITTVAMRYPNEISGFLCTILIAVMIRSAIIYSSERLPMAALYACACLPFAWTFVDRGILSRLPNAWLAVTSLPGMIPMGIISHRFQLSQDPLWIGSLFTIVEILIGWLLIRSGARRSIAYFLLLLIASTVGSMALDALMRA